MVSSTERLGAGRGEGEWEVNSWAHLENSENLGQERGQGIREMGDITLVKTPWLGLTGTGSHRWVASGRMSAMEPHGCPSPPHEARVGHTAPSSADLHG